jgi:hypothetical protein
MPQTPQTLPQLHRQSFLRGADSGYSSTAGSSPPPQAASVNSSNVVSMIQVSNSL